MAIEKNDLMTSRIPKGKSTLGPAHHGGPKDGFYAADGEPGLLVHHDPQRARQADHGQHSDIARAGAAKRLAPVSVHNGMRTQTKAGATAFGGDHKSAIDSLTGQVVVPGADGRAATAHPLTKPPVDKNDRPVQVNPGTRSRHADPLAGGAPGQAHALSKAPIYPHPSTGQPMSRDDPHAIGRLILDEGAALDVQHPRHFGRRR